MKQLNLHFALLSLMLGLWFPTSENAHAQPRVTTARLTAQRTFFANLKKLCGRQLLGATVFPQNADHPLVGKPLVLSVRSCAGNVIRIPFHVGEDKSRTFILTLTDKGLLFKHDHRHPDGTPDRITMYGGWAAPGGTPYQQSFPADDETKKLIPEAATNVWTLQMKPATQQLTYSLERNKQPRYEGSFTQVPHWTLQRSGVTARLRGISAVTDRVVWASGSGNTVLRTLNGGQTWQKLKVTANSNTPLDFRDIDAIDASTAYVLSIGNGPASRIYKTTDGGRTWTLQFKSDNPKEFWDAMSFWDAANGIVLGDSLNGQFCIMTTSNGGRTWTRVPAAVLPPALENEGAFAASGTNIAVWENDHAWIATGAGAKARVLRTEDRGRTWKISETPLMAGPSAGIFSIAFRDAQHGVIVGGDYRKEEEAIDNLAVTSDGGATWTLVKGLSGFRSVVAYVPVMSAGQTQPLIASGPSGTDYSIDDGRTWMRLDGPGFDTLSFGRLTGRGRHQSMVRGWAAGAKGSIARLGF